MTPRLRSNEQKRKAVERVQRWRAANPGRHNSYMRQYRQAGKAEAFEAYGGAQCSCCGETELSMLTLDHINMNGAEHRKQLSLHSGGFDFYRRLKSEGWPEGYRVLCFNCNVAAFRNGGVCPHVG